jgi:hypothetical protein
MKSLVISKLKSRTTMTDNDGFASCDQSLECVQDLELGH